MILHTAFLSMKQKIGSRQGATAKQLNVYINVDMESQGAPFESCILCLPSGALPIEVLWYRQYVQLHNTSSTCYAALTAWYDSHCLRVCVRLQNTSQIRTLSTTMCATRMTQ